MRSAARCTPRRVECGLSLRPPRSSCNARWRKTAQQSPRRCRCAPCALSREQALRSKAAAVPRQLCCAADAPAPRSTGRARHIGALGRARRRRNATLVRCSATAAAALARPCTRCGAHRVSPARRSTVIMEDDPKPGALLGRMSFRRGPAALHARTRAAASALVRCAEACVGLRRNYNAETEKLHAEAEARVAVASGAPAQHSVVHRTRRSCRLGLSQAQRQARA